MRTNNEPPAFLSGRTLAGIAVAGVATGLIDLLGAFSTYVPKGATELGVLKYIASGILGAAALHGGPAIAGVGFVVHCGLTTLMAALYFAAATAVRGLNRWPWLSGAVYGVLTFVAMVYVAVPLSAAPGWKYPGGWDIVSGLLAHIFYVGIPISHVARYCLIRSKSS